MLETATLTGARPAAAPLLDRLHEWVVTVDHKRLGFMYMIYAIVFLVIGGLEATVMRIQLAYPNLAVVSPQAFNRLFTMHGTTMVFFVGMPILFGFANYLVPLMIGARDMAFPRLNAFGFWTSAFGGLLLYFSFLGGEGLAGAGSAPDVGWFAYAPLTAKAFSQGHSTDYWTLGLLVSGFGTIGAAVNVVTTILCMRCPGMTLGRMPLFVWLILVVGRHDAHRHAAADRRADHAAARPLSRRALLRHAGRRLGGAVAALLLDLRPPRGLHPDAARLRLRVRDHPGLLAQGDVRLSRDGRRHRRHRVHRRRACGRITCSRSA